jgi:hypothetical protein
MGMPHDQIDTTGEDREAEEAVKNAEDLIAWIEADRGRSTLLAEHFQRRRDALRDDVIVGKLEDEYAQIVIKCVDLRQAAAETATDEE